MQNQFPAVFDNILCVFCRFISSSWTLLWL